MEWRDATLLLMLSSVSRISQWSDIEELVEPGRRMGGDREMEIERQG